MQVSSVAQKYLIYTKKDQVKQNTKNADLQTVNVQTAPFNPLLSKYIIKQASRILPVNNIQPVT